MADVSAEMERSRSEVAAYLREFADKLESRGRAEIRDDDGRVTVVAGNESATVNPPETVQFSIEIDTDPSLLEVGASQAVTFSLRWDAKEVESSDGLDIQ